MKTKYSLLIALLYLSQSLNASVCRFSSGAEQVALLELYTSEGCSSCPPADRWVSKLKNDKRLWKEIVPVVFHVDYWDYLGWKDQLASNLYTRRQQAYRLKGYSSAVYTPGFFLNGKEWRKWYYSGKLNIKKKSKPGKLDVILNKENVSIAYDSNSYEQKSGRVHVAYLGMNIKSNIKAGENSGKNLKHDFAVLKYESKEVIIRAKNSWNLKRTSRFKNIPTKAMAVWITFAHDPKPIQAAGALCNQ